MISEENCVQKQIKLNNTYILAYQKATNYGAVLQIFALQTYLEKKGLNVEVIDYIPDWMKVSLKNQPSVLSFFSGTMGVNTMSFLSYL